MAFFGAGPWTDAASYGEGAGQALSQSLLQLPQQRYALALQQKQMQAQQQQRQLMGMLAMQKQQELSNYRQGLLQQKDQANQGMNQYHTMLEQLRMNQQNRPLVVPAGASVFMPQGGGAGTGEQTNQSLSATPPNPQGGQMPGYQMMQAPQRLPNQMTDNQSLANTLKALDLYGKFSQGTNPASMYGANTASNILSNPNQFLQQQRGMQMPIQAPQMQPTNVFPQQNTNDPLGLFRQ